MSDGARVRTTAEIAVSDYEGAIELLTRAAKYIEEHLPDTFAWEVFTDATHERMIWYEEFADEQALLDYEQSMTDHGFREGIGKYGDLERVVVLGSVSDPGLLEQLRAMQAVQMNRTLGVTR